ncbi:helix-turn-helix domain-containing protein [Aquimarina sp. W85]|uniref:helix-turn-helix domain-containing protein n=1 Tax=Aquimarina rhodophyticola TaxID=3342246 RepID=UPI003673512C
MDKKRRENITSNVVEINETQQIGLHTVIELVDETEHCGIKTLQYQIKSNVGKGSLVTFAFSGVEIIMYDIVLYEDFKINGDLLLNVLEMSFLMDGTKIIGIKKRNEAIILEHQECYLLYLSKLRGSVNYLGKNPLKEIKIRMSSDFIKKYNLDQEYDLSNVYAIPSEDSKFIKPICNKSQAILADILSDNRIGLLKRLFLESKVLELLLLQIDQTNVTVPMLNGAHDHLVKKLYKVQHLISKDISKQYSIKELARIIGINDFVLKKEFKQLFGMTIFEYAMEQRLTTAKNLLLHSKKPIYEIAEAVGYKNSTHFSAAFKKLEGVTPKTFRKPKLP